MAPTAQMFFKAALWTLSKDTRRDCDYVLQPNLSDDCSERPSLTKTIVSPDLNGKKLNSPGGFRSNFKDGW